MARNRPSARQSNNLRKPGKGHAARGPCARGIASAGLAPGLGGKKWTNQIGFCRQWTASAQIQKMNQLHRPAAENELGGLNGWPPAPGEWPHPADVGCPSRRVTRSPRTGRPRAFPARPRSNPPRRRQSTPPIRKTELLLPESSTLRRARRLCVQSKAQHFADCLDASINGGKPQVDNCRATRSPGCTGCRGTRCGPV